MSIFVALLIIGFISVNSGYVVPIPRDQTRKEYFRSVMDYWTPERMASARPLEVILTPDLRIPFQNNEPMPNEGPERLLAPPVPRRTRDVDDPDAAGKIFFTMNGLRYMCSGSVVNARNRDTIVTAGHCVYNSTSKEYASNFIFMPNYHKGERPHGTFPARRIEPTDTWKTKVDYNYDFAIVLVDTNDEGEHVQDVVGAFGVSVNANETGSTHLFGFPANNANGEIMTNCFGQTTKTSSIVTLFANNFQGIHIDCGMNGGSSGGPWLRNYNSNTGTGIQISVTSFASSMAKGKIQGPLMRQSNFGVIFEKFENL